MGGLLNSSNEGFRLINHLPFVVHQTSVLFHWYIQNVLRSLLLPIVLKSKNRYRWTAKESASRSKNPGVFPRSFRCFSRIYRLRCYGLKNVSRLHNDWLTSEFHIINYPEFRSFSVFKWQVVSAFLLPEPEVFNLTVDIEMIDRPDERLVKKFS